MKHQVDQDPNRLIEAFFSRPEHVRLFLHYWFHPTQDNKIHLDKAFKKCLAKIRTLAYFIKIMDYEAKRFDRKLRLTQSKVSANLDNHDIEESKSNLYEQKNDYDESYVHEPLEEWIDSYPLYVAIKKLTKKQKRVLFLAYIRNQSDSDIASSLTISRQAVAKMRKVSLQKIRRDIGA
jgi:DNA-directed RNA polymerase specialized sigma subunit